MTEVDVLLVDLAERTGGAEKRLVQLAGALARCGVAAVTVCLRDGALRQQLQAAQLPYVAVPYGRADPRTAILLARTIRRTGAHAIDAHNVQSQFWSAVATAVARVPRKVATVHSQYRWSEGGALKGHAYDAVLRLARRTGWSFVAVSDTVADHLRRLGVDEAAIQVVWSAVDVQAPADPAVRSDVRARHDLDDGAFVLVCVARMVPAKDHLLLLDAFAAARAVEPRLQLLLIGDGPLRAVVEDAVRARGLDSSVRLLGHREDVLPLMAAADLCVLSSRTEGLPYALLEATAAGVPVLATSVGAIGTVYEDGVTATLVPPADAPRFCEALLGAVRSPAQLTAMAERARREVTGAGLQGMLSETALAYGLPRRSTETVGAA